MRQFITVLILLGVISANAQQEVRPLTNRIIVKTNMLSLLARRPTFSVEKALNKTFTVERSFVQYSKDIWTPSFGFPLVIAFNETLHILPSI